MLPYDRIVSRCEETGVTQAFLNKLINGYRGKITELGKGKTTLTDLEISKIANALLTSTDYLLGKTDDPTPSGQKEKPTPVSKSGPTYPPEYDLLTPEHKAIVDRLIADLAKSQLPG